MKSAAVGFRVHSGWAAVVALAVNKGGPFILARERARLVRSFTYEYRQPYHTAAKMCVGERAAFLSGVRAEARHFAFRAIRDLKAALEREGYALQRAGLLLASGRPLPGLASILASHSLIHTADGELFREAILDGAARCGLRCATMKEKSLLESASRILGVKPADLSRRIRGLGRLLGPPWSQDEKYASLVAWLAVAAPSLALSSARFATRRKSPR